MPARSTCQHAFRHICCGVASFTFRACIKLAWSRVDYGCSSRHHGRPTWQYISYDATTTQSGLATDRRRNLARSPHFCVPILRSDPQVHWQLDSRCSTARLHRLCRPEQLAERRRDTQYECSLAGTICGWVVKGLGGNLGLRGLKGSNDSDVGQ